MEDTGDPGEEDGQQLKPAPSTFKSKVWAHFGFYAKPGNNLDMAKAVCKLCRATVTYSGNTTNLMKHLTRHHPDVKVGTGTAEEKTKQQQTLEEAFNNKLPKNSEKARRITTCIGQYICKDLRPYSVIEGTGFRNMIYNLEPRYVIPSRKFFSETVIPKLYNETTACVKEELNIAERVALTCDAWTSRATESYVTLTAHYISEDWSLSSQVLQTRKMHESHTGANIAELLHNVLSEWSISEDTVLVTDNAANMDVATQLASLRHIKCFAHALNLASQRALKLPSIAKLLGRVRRVTGFFHRSAMACSVLEEKQKLLGLAQHKLITDVVTRWNSAFDMVERFLEQQAAVTAALLSPQLRKREKDITTFTETDISNAEEFVKALRPVKIATCVMSDEAQPTLSLVAPLRAQLLQATKEKLEDSPFVRDMKGAFHNDLSKRYTSEEKKTTLHMASSLDPRFKGLPFLSEEEKQETIARLTAEAAATIDHRAQANAEGQDLEDLTDCEQEDKTESCANSDGPPPAKRRDTCALAQLLGNTFGDRQTSGPITPEKSALDCAAEEVKRFQGAPSLPLSDSPLVWWKQHCNEYPLLAKLAKCYLCIPGTSVSAERVFSTAGDIITAQRSCLKSEHVDQLLFLNKNLFVPRR